MEKNLKIDIHAKNLTTIAKALSSQVRIDILKLLARRKSLNVNEIASILDLPMSTTSTNVQILEEAGLIITIYQPGIRGSMKVCSAKHEMLMINMITDEEVSNVKSEVIDMPIGNYYNFQVEPTCGLASEDGYIEKDDEVMSFYSPKRTNAQLIWFYRGFVEYLFPNNIRNKGKITSIEFSLEICSEAPNYRIDWPSDITVWINDIEIDTWTCPGDFGGRQGIYTPKWWSLNATQFGVLKRWQINDHGTFFDFTKVSKITLKDLNLNANDAIKFRIGVKKDAKNIGGINIFGSKFGDYQQNIVLRIDYLE